MLSWHVFLKNKNKLALSFKLIFRYIDDVLVITLIASINWAWIEGFHR